MSAKNKGRLELTGKAADDFFRAVVAEQERALSTTQPAKDVIIPLEFRDYLWSLIEVERYRLHQDLIAVALSDDTNEESSDYIKEQLANLNALRLCFGGAE